METNLINPTMYAWINKGGQIKDEVVKKEGIPVRYKNPKKQKELSRYNQKFKTFAYIGNTPKDTNVCENFELLPEMWIKVDGEPYPIEDFGDWMLFEEKVTKKEAFERFLEKLEKKKHGGKIDDMYRHTTKETWDMWNDAQREHFLLDHVVGEDGYRAMEIDKFVNMEYEDLPQQVKDELNIHTSQARYQKGGGTESLKAKYGTAKSEIIIWSDGSGYQQKFVEDDGGRKKAGYKGTAGDCVTRSIAIATGKSYQEVYDELSERIKQYGSTRNTKLAGIINKMKCKTPRDGVHKEIYSDYLDDLGWEWVPTMKFGEGCRVHLRGDELPNGALVVKTSKHLTCVIDGVIHDTYDPSRQGTRCVYGYWKKKKLI